MSETISAQSPPALALRDIARAYQQGRAKVDVFANVSLALNAGDAVALTGPSGSGKSSLLHIAGLLEAPSGGDVAVKGRWRSQMGERERTYYRRTAIGFVFQFHFLLPEFTALENVAMAAIIAGWRRREAREAAEALLVQLGLAERLHHRPGELSGGEQQRTAVARALVKKPALILADEPTGNLDPRTGRAVWQALCELAQDSGSAILAATHNQELAALMPRHASLDEGSLTNHPLTNINACTPPPETPQSQEAVETESPASQQDD